MAAEEGFEPGKQGNSLIPKKENSAGESAVNTVAEITESGEYETQELEIVAATDGDVITRITPTSPYSRVVISYKDAGSATSKILYAAFNAATDGTTELNTAGSRTPIAIGDEHEQFFPDDGLCNTIDIKTSDTETGTALVTIFGRLS